VERVYSRHELVISSECEIKRYCNCFVKRMVTVRSAGRPTSIESF
jgi:hypothetical protein